MKIFNRRNSEAELDAELRAYLTEAHAIVCAKLTRKRRLELGLA